VVEEGRADATALPSPPHGDELNMWCAAEVHEDEGASERPAHPCGVGDVVAGRPCRARGEGPEVRALEGAERVHLDPVDAPALATLEGSDEVACYLNVTDQ
jgi:hypothetical protein